LEDESGESSVVADSDANADEEEFILSTGRLGSLTDGDDEAVAAL